MCIVSYKCRHVSCVSLLNDMLHCVAEDYLSVAVRSLNHDVPGLGAANAVQREAVTHALVHSFSLVQGPPGTGRIFTAVRLAALFIGINNSLPAKYERNDVRPQLLVCGPSNNSVDVIAGELMWTWCHSDENSITVSYCLASV